MAEITLVKKYSRFLAGLKNRRKAASRLQRFLPAFRKLPVYRKYFNAINFYSYYVVLERILEQNKGGNYFEWGPGHNTRLAYKLMQKVFSVENDKTWFEKYIKEFPVIFSPISENSCLDYAAEIKKIAEPINVAFVDGRCRNQCIAACAEKHVPLVVMHDSLHPFTYKPSVDSAPPQQNEGIPYYQGYNAYKYFIEIPDLRTIVLCNNDLEDYEKMFKDFYLRSGSTGEYLTILNHNA